MPSALRLAVLLFAICPAVAMAHPHVLVTAKAEMVFDAAGMVTAVRNIWRFDEEFTALATEGLDLDNDGILTDDELAPLAEINMNSLALYSFFTSVSLEGPAPMAVTRTAFQTFFFDRTVVQSAQALALSPPADYWLEIEGQRLTLFFTLPLDEPLQLRPSEAVTVAILDPEYIVAFDFVPDVPFALIDGAADCISSHRPPGELTPQTAAALATIAVDQPIPPELLAATANLAHRFTVACHA